MRGSTRQNRFCRIADRFNLLARIQEADDTARTRFQPLITPRKGADQATSAERKLDVAAEIFRVQQAFLERPAMKGEHVLPHLAAGLLVGEFEAAEEFRRRLAAH